MEILSSCCPREFEDLLVLGQRLGWGVLGASSSPGDSVTELPECGSVRAAYLGEWLPALGKRPLRGLLGAVLI